MNFPCSSSRFKGGLTLITTLKLLVAKSFCLFNSVAYELMLFENTGVAIVGCANIWDYCHNIKFRFNL